MIKIKVLFFLLVIVIVHFPPLTGKCPVGVSHPVGIAEHHPISTRAEQKTVDELHSSTFNYLPGTLIQTMQRIVQ